MTATNYLIDTLVTLYAYIVLLRFLLQWAGADFYNQMSQFVVKATQPVVGPIRAIIRPIGRWDIAALIVVWILMFSKTQFMFLTGSGGFGNIFQISIHSLFEVLIKLINVLEFSIIAQVILSWINPMGSRNPMIDLLYQLTEPVLSPLRRLLPPAGGFDFTPIIALIGLHTVSLLLEQDILRAILA